MQRRSKGVVQLEWVCPNCDTRNPGPVKNCQNCGAPQPDNVQFQRAADEKLITDEKVVQAAKAGADIHCGFCGTRNPATAETCSQCGADLKEGKARQAGQVMQAAPSTPKVVTCSNCGSENSGSAKTCTNCGAPIKLPQAKAPAPIAASAQAGKVAAQANKKPVNWLVAGGIGAVLVMCCIAVLMLFVFPSRSVTGTVSGVSWQTSVPVQEVQPVNYSNERGNPPSDAYNVSCRTDSQEVCEDKTIDKGNGYAEVVTECHTVKDQYCSYTVDEWTTIQTYDLNGTDLNPEYSSPNISSDQRLGNSSTQLQVYFSTSDGELTYSPNSVTEFQQYQPGSQWTLKLNAVGSVLSVER
ncbi:MAG TPA: zinc ribbon domain-containing protein [Anaerolineales bacterium]|nr:zinc ribbon domain-containing protein [Anaerolineales bacterium]HNH25878.1 zinc ribbon domain-containing protein [Anaerolineales bacterium]